MNTEKIINIAKRIERREAISISATSTLQRTYTSEVNHFGREFIMRWRVELNRRILLNNSMMQVLVSELREILNTQVIVLSSSL